MIDVWLIARRFSSPLGGRVMPCPGAAGEQPAALMDAIALLDGMDPPRGG